ncbi:hypothetical protein VNO78_25368 [Psophocarpus tetragonolobus]|uniref:Uncharacterized protein n=1 Tax=Psophocarpus tetragonolobus TaxID=3891 RepID=A0AAN9S9E4_PSOTE
MFQHALCSYSGRCYKTPTLWLLDLAMLMKRKPFEIKIYSSCGGKAACIYLLQPHLVGASTPSQCLSFDDEKHQENVLMAEKDEFISLLTMTVIEGK